MDTSGFDTVARHIPLYREWLLALPGWVKDQAFDIHIASGQPLSLCGQEGTCFLGRRGASHAPRRRALPTTSQQLRELFLTVCGHSVFRHEEELRQGYVRLGEDSGWGCAASAVMEGGQVRGLRDITASGVPHPPEGAGCGDRLFLEVSLWRRGSWWLARPPAERPPSCGM